MGTHVDTQLSEAQIEEQSDAVIQQNLAELETNLAGMRDSMAEVQLTIAELEADNESKRILIQPSRQSKAAARRRNQQFYVLCGIFAFVLTLVILFQVWYHWTAQKVSDERQTNVILIPESTAEQLMKAHPAHPLS